MTRRDTIYLLIIAALVGALAAPLVSAQVGGFGDWTISEQSDVRIVLERDAVATATVPATATSAPATATATAVAPTATNVPPTATVAPTNTPQPSGFQLLYSLSSNRSNPQPLTGATVSGNIYVFVLPPAGLSGVDFYLNGAHRQRENNPPWDFAGGSVSTAEAWNATGSGARTIRADLDLTGGGEQSLTAVFTVGTGPPPPTPTTGPTATPGPSPTPTPSPTPAPIPDFELIPTYHSMSVYVPWNGGGETLPVDYRIAGGDWHAGQPLLVIGNQARGSLVGLQPATAYEVRVGTQTETMTTWSEVYPSGGVTHNVATNAQLQSALGSANPGDTISVAAGTYAPFDVTRSGNANGYIHIEAESGAVVTSASNETLISIAAQYVVVSGFELSGGNNGIRVNSPSQWVVIDGNTIDELNHTGDTDGPITLGDTFSSQNVVAHITVQNNVIHAAPGDPAQSAVYVKGTSGNHAIRYNEVYFHHDGSGAHGTDCFGGGPNFQDHGGFHRDTDVYGNYCEGATDDAISADGGGMNVRIWDNISTQTQTGLSIAPVRLGPVYYFRNVTYLQEVHWIDKCLGVKTGENSAGTTYLYHNVWYSPNAGDCDGKIHGFSNDGGGNTGNPIFVNNIMQVTDRIYSGSGVHGDYNLLFTDGDSFPIFDCCSSNANSLPAFVSATGREAHSIWGTADFDASYNLLAGSAGIDAGVLLPGFNDADSAWPLVGSAPDMGRGER